MKSILRIQNSLEYLKTRKVTPPIRRLGIRHPKISTSKISMSRTFRHSIRKNIIKSVIKVICSLRNRTKPVNNENLHPEEHFAVGVGCSMLRHDVDRTALQTERDEP